MTPSIHPLFHQMRTPDGGLSCTEATTSDLITMASVLIDGLERCSELGLELDYGEDLWRESGRGPASAVLAELSSAPDGLVRTPVETNAMLALYEPSSAPEPSNPPRRSHAVPLDELTRTQLEECIQMCWAALQRQHRIAQVLHTDLADILAGVHVQAESAKSPQKIIMPPRTRVG